MRPPSAETWRKAQRRCQPEQPPGKASGGCKRLSSVAELGFEAPSGKMANIANPIAPSPRSFPGLSSR